MNTYIILLVVLILPALTLGKKPNKGGVVRGNRRGTVRNTNIKSPGDACGCTGIIRRPVCGTDGNTYNNVCELNCANQNSQVDNRRCCKDSVCKEYVGRENLNGRCKRWIDNRGIYTPKPDPIRDENFPERSVRNAQNYCRNPDKGKSGLWCYTGVGKPLQYERCVNVPQCSITVAYQGECRSIGSTSG
ncbi:unnamed protein product [Notodromas monacha]|uniref:Uncharacterized protein n=1 Tax=Notodromas monacha TaxID=399045 RepID=A0A7R9BUF2_9CRUS|nr:unnamed protein product [Notodromas monacha]CAG0921951.1 unnamed protein product [Notodromas monacha]